MDVTGELATSGARALVRAMATDRWPEVRDRVAVLLGDGREDVAAELERSRSEALDSPELASEVVAEWRPALCRLLTDDPDTTAAVRALRDEFTPPPGTDAGNRVEGDVRGTAVQAGTVHGDVSAPSYGGDHVDFRGSTFHGPVTGKSPPPPAP
ncbi:hypothetical protein FHX37_0037 [Haloactinospora alba]|uniref:Uncharacterized protein n=1 Tax=Haloactinospora alba TaxID=405555 RepID=A0A543NEC7_9ACTN|nr:hypothetical protein [Haloactinospora alba]TQN30176.1 hypothetical protein FHX37_0037 [Haloactinospora alba]